MTTATKKRLNLEFPLWVVDKFDRLMELSGSTTRTEVIRKSLKLLERVLEHQAAGGKLKLVHEDGSQETLEIL